MPYSNEQSTPGVSWHENNHLLLLQPYGGNAGVSQIRLGKGQCTGLRSVQETVTIAVCSLEQGLQGCPVDRQALEVVVQQGLHEGVCWDGACLHVLCHTHSSHEWQRPNNSKLQGHGRARQGMAQHRMVQHSTARHSTAQQDTAQHMDAVIMQSSTQGSPSQPLSNPCSLNKLL